MLKKKKLILISLSILLIIVMFYIYILFPKIEKDFLKEPIEINTSLWQNQHSDTLNYYYLEYSEIRSVEQILKNSVDSIFVVNYLHSHPSSVTLKNPELHMVHFTNNFTGGTLLTYSYYLKTKNSKYLDIFLKNIDWMYDNVTILEDSIGLWKNENMIYDKYNLDYGWSSAFSQGYGLSAFCRAYQVTHQNKYLELAEMVINSFNLDYRSGGIVDIDSDGNYWYLEYPANPPGYVLNGMIFGLFGIYDYWRITGSEKAMKYFNRGIKTLTENLYRYDKGYWSAYDLLYNHSCAGYNYHKNVHIPQLKILYQICNEPVFEQYSKKFTRYLGEPYLTMFKIKFTVDSIRRRLTYKNPLKKYSKQRFK